MKFAIPLLYSLTISSSYSALSGAWETFPTEDKATDWLLYDYADDMIYAPNWFDRENPYIGAPFAENSAITGSYDQGLWFYATSVVADGAFTGNFHRKGIRGIEVDVFFTDADKLDFCDVVIGSDSTGEVVYYYSVDFSGTNFTGDPDWYFLNPLFTESWFRFDEAADAFVETPLTPAILSNVTEIGIRFFPTTTNDTPWTPQIDNVALTPTVNAPTVDFNLSNGNYILSFDQNEGNQYTIQNYNFTINEWESVTGQTDLVGNSNYSFEKNLIPNGEFFRVLSSASYKQVSVTH